MRKPIGWLFFTLAALVAAVALAAIVLFLLVDPNRYRPALERVVMEATGFDLTIDGDIGWTFRPLFGIHLNDVRLANPAARQELASFSGISLSLAPSRLLRGELVMDEIIARDLHVNWHVNAEGTSNWVTGGPQATPAPPEQADDGLPVSVDIRRLDINNTSLSFRDVQQGIDARLENLNISSRNTNLDNRPFPLEVTTRILDYAGDRDLRVRLRTQAQVDFDAGDIILNELRFNLSPMVLEGRVALQDFRDAAQWESELESNTFNLFYLLETLTGYDAGPGIELDDNRFQLATRFNGDARGATVSSLEISLDDMGASLDGDILYPTENRPLTLAYRLQAGELELDPWLPPPTQEEPDDAAGAEAATGEEETAPLPFALLQDVNVRGQHNIEALQVNGLRLTDIEAALVVDNGELDLQWQPAEFYSGELAARVRIDSNATPPRIDTRLTAENINATGLAERFTLLSPFTGRLDLDGEHSLAGHTVDELLDSITGLSHANMTEGSADITMIKRVFDAISVLSPDGNMTRDWPDRVQFRELQGQWLLNDGLASDQEITLTMDNLDISGSGGIELDEQRFDYRFGFTVLGDPAPRMIRIDPDYQDIAWPVRCDADFDARPLQYCSPDLQRVREVLTQIARDEIERRARDAVSDEVEELQERARGLLDRLRR
ncbi:MAG: AsmA family protein [Pseudohongiellaceae bacterium]